MRKRNLGLDIGPNSIGWALTEFDLNNHSGKIQGIGTRIIPMSQDILTDFEKGNSKSATAERTRYRSMRRRYFREILRRERLHRVLNIMGFLPEHYREKIDFSVRKGRFTEETKLNYKKTADGDYIFIFKESFNEMLQLFKAKGIDKKIPYDWTLYYLRKKALREKISKEELSWILLNFNKKRGYYQLRNEEENTQDNKEKIYVELRVAQVEETEEKTKDGKKLYKVIFENGWEYPNLVTDKDEWEGKIKEFIVSISRNKDGSVKRTFKKVDPEKDWEAIKKKTENDIEKSGKHVGEFIFDRLLENPSIKIRGNLVQTIDRKFYKKELQAILNKQKEFHPELTDKTLLEKSLIELYPINEAHRNTLKDKDLPYLITEDIIFYQRPLKSQKSLIAECPYERIKIKVKRIDPQTGKEIVREEEKGIKVISKSHPFYQEFRLWQFINNLRIYRKEKRVNDEWKFNVDVTDEMFPGDEDLAELFDFLKDKKEAGQKDVIKFLEKNRKIKSTDKDNYRWNYVEEKKYPMMPTRAGFLARLKKTEGINPKEFLTVERETELWHLIYSVQDKEAYKKALRTFARKNGIDEKSFVEAFEKYPPFKSEYGAYSYKALKKIVPLMRSGKYWDAASVPEQVKERIDHIIERLDSIDYDPERLDKISDDDIPHAVLKSFISMKGRNPYAGLQTHQAVYAVYGRHSEAEEVQYWRTPDDIDAFLNKFKQHSLRNPIVEQVVLETLRTVRDIWRYYGDGKPGFFDEIHVELARSLKNPAEKRKEISKRNLENEKTNRRIRALLKELIGVGAKPESPNHFEILKIYEQDVLGSVNEMDDDIKKVIQAKEPTQKQIERYKLWLDQKYISPYTGKIIPLSKLFTHEYQIEHILPQSRYFDNSLSNKVICESAVNLEKGNMTAYEFIKEKGGSIVTGDHKLFTLDEYVNHVNKYFSHNRKKRQNLLSEDIPDSFIERQLNDTRYISKVVKGLLSNIVRDEGENAVTTKRLIPVVGSITATLRHDWGLNDKWNEIILPRFKRLNQMLNRQDFTFVNEDGVEVPKIPDELAGKINKKRIDHRHHALDALVIALTTREHIQYLNSLNNKKIKYELREKLLTKDKDGKYTRTFKLPWPAFPVEAKEALEKIIPSFKQNLRVINKATNKYWKWIKQPDGSYKKQKVKQTKGDHWSIRKPLHKETIYGKLDFIPASGKDIPTASREPLSSIADKNIKNIQKRINKIADKRIREVIIPNHLKHFTDENGNIDYEKAFGPEGIEQLNKNIVELNEGKPHKPIYRVKFYELGQRFPLSDNPSSPKHKKYVEAAKGTNLFYNIYWDEKKQKRNFETVPLKEVIEHQKQVARLPKDQRTPAPVNPALGKYLFTLSPGDLVYVPEEGEDVSQIDFRHLTTEQRQRIYKMVSSTGKRSYYIPAEVSQPIYNKKEFESLNKMERSIDGHMIKERAIKIITDRLGNIIDVKTGEL